MRRDAKLSLLFCALLALSLVTKLAGQRQAAPDDDRLYRDAARALAAQGFGVTRATASLWLLSAQRGVCRLRLARADDARATLAALQADAAPDRLLIGYRDRWASGLPPLRAGGEHILQHVAFQIGLVVPRPAVLALAANAPCPPPQTLLAGLEQYPRSRY